MKTPPLEEVQEVHVVKLISGVIIHLVDEDVVPEEEEEETMEDIIHLLQYLQQLQV